MSAQKQFREKILPALILLSSFTFGCVYSQKYVASIPDVQGAGLSLTEKSIQQKKHHIIDLEGLQFSIKPFNARLVSLINSWFLFIPIPFDKVYPDAEQFGKHDRSANPPFLIEVAFHPIEGDLKMDPSQTVLHLGGQDYQPVQMVVPSEVRPLLPSETRLLKAFGGRSSQTLELCFRPANHRLEDLLRPLQQVRVPTGEQACVWLSFDVAPPPPETEFSISVNGVEMAGKPVQIPTIRFIKGITYLHDKVL